MGALLAILLAGYSGGGGGIKANCPSCVLIDSSLTLSDFAKISGTKTGYQLELLNSTDYTQVHIRSGATTDTGMYLLSEGPDEFFVTGGSIFNGTNWVAKFTSAGEFGYSLGTFYWDGDTNLTAGNTFTPTQLMRLNTASGLIVTSQATFNGAFSLGSALGIGSGGTNNTSYTTWGVNYFDGGKIASTAAGSSGQCLKSNASSAPTYGSCTVGTTELVDVLFSGASALTLNQTLGGEVLPAATTLTDINFRVTAVTGTGGTTGMVIQASDGTNTCTFTNVCNPTANSNVKVAAVNGAGTGCALANAASVTYTVAGTSDCTTYPVLLDLIKVEGTR